MKILTKEGRARTGIFTTKQGRSIHTPFFMPVATKGTIKSLSTLHLKKIGTDSIICNGYFLSLKPGDKYLARHKGIHNFINFDNVIFTDSGGFQMISDHMLVKKTEEGVILNDPYSRKTKLITPKDCIKFQNNINSDVAMMLDDHVAYDISKRKHSDAVEQNYEWGKQAIKHHSSNSQMLFGIIQGGTFEELRKKSSELMVSLNFDGYAIGGLVIGEPPEKTYPMIDICTSLLPENKIRYAMGIGNPPQILECISLGCDCFDSTFPTQHARHGTAFTFNGKINLDDKIFIHDTSCLEEGCHCLTCKNYTRAYLHHLVKMKEYVICELLTMHNLTFMQRLMLKCREEISKNNFNKFKEEFNKRWK